MRLSLAVVAFVLSAPIAVAQTIIPVTTLANSGAGSLRSAITTANSATAPVIDIRVAGTSARIGQPEVSLGIMPAAGGTYRLPRLVGLGRAKELIFTGAIIDAIEADRIGLVNRIVPDEQVLSTAQELGKKIAQNAVLAVRLAKMIMNQGARGASLSEVESVAQAVLFESEEKRRRMSEFLERKRGKGAS